MTRSIPWLRVFIEGVVIVGSILLAFGIDAWWDGRQERAEEQRAIQSLLRDFEAAEQDLLRQVSAIDSAAVAAEAVLELVGPNADLGHADSLGMLIPRLIRRPTFQPPTGTLDALLGSGNLSLIRNDTLRAALASFPSHLADLAETQGYGSEVVFGQLLPFLNERVPMLRYGLMARGKSEFEGNPTGLLRSLQFENLAQNRLMGIRFTLQGTDAMGQRITAIRERLESELAR